MTPTPSELRAAFDAPAPLTIGIEEELMVVDGGTLDLAPAGDLLLDERFKRELPATQIEIVTAPAATVAEAIAQLAAARADLDAAARARGLRVIGAGMHPFAAAAGSLSEGERYERIDADYGYIARRQLVCALQVHVAVGCADRSLTAYNALRPRLPLLAALGANAPFHVGEDTGLASMRPVVGRMLPRQGVPPALESWDAFADALAFVGDTKVWWWELRPHPRFGTLELRVPDTQTTLEDAAALAGVAHALVAHLAESRADGHAETWRIEENRWSACRDGVEGAMADLRTGRRTATRDLLGALIDELEPAAAEVGCSEELASARALVEANGAMRQRAIAGSDGLRGLVRRLAGDFARAR